MAKIELTIPFDEEKLSALNFSLKKENTTAQRRMEQTLNELYETTVPQPLREYLDSKAASESKERPKRAYKKQPAAVQPAVDSGSDQNHFSKENQE